MIYVLAILTLLLLFDRAGAIADSIGLRTTVDGFPRFVEAAMRGGCNRMRLRLYHTDSKRCVEFVKLIRGGQPTHFFMQVRKRCCNTEEFLEAQNALKRHDIDFQIQDCGTKLARITVECGTDLSKSIVAARAVLVEAFRLTSNDTLRAGMHGSADVRLNAWKGWDGEPPARRFP